MEGEKKARLPSSGRSMYCSDKSFNETWGKNVIKKIIINKIKITPERKKNINFHFITEVDQPQVKTICLKWPLGKVKTKRWSSEGPIV